MTKELTIESHFLFEQPIKVDWSDYHNQMIVLGLNSAYLFNPDTFEVKPFQSTEGSQFKDVSINKDGSIALLLQSDVADSGEIKILSPNLFSIKNTIRVFGYILKFSKFTEDGNLIVVAESSVQSADSEDVSSKIIFIDWKNGQIGEGLVVTNGVIVGLEINSENKSFAISKGGDVLLIPTKILDFDISNDSESSMNSSADTATSESSLDIIRFEPKIIGNVGSGVSSFSIGLKTVSLSNETQKKIRVFVGSRPWQNDRWDSQEIEAQETGILYGGGDNLVPGQSYWVHVSVWHSDSGWSSPQIKKFTMPYRYYEDYSSDSSASSSSSSSSSLSSSTQIRTTSSSQSSSSSSSSSSLSSTSSSSISSSSSSSISSSSSSSISSSSSSSISSSISSSSSQSSDSSSSTSSYSSQSTLHENWEYNLLGPTDLEITKYIGDDSTVYLPTRMCNRTPYRVRGGCFQTTWASAAVVIEVPENYTMLDDDCFKDGIYGPTNITTINVDVDNPNYQSVSGILFNKNLTELLQYPDKKIGGYTIPSTVTEINRLAFYHCMTTSVIIPGSVTIIDQASFGKCVNLSSVTTTSGLETIWNYAFSGCTALGALNIPASVTYIGDLAFSFNETLGITVWFLGGTAPSVGATIFFDTTATVYYPLTGTGYTPAWRSAVSDRALSITFHTY